jgi:hypothetical protein
MSGREDVDVDDDADDVDGGEEGSDGTGDQDESSGEEGEGAEEVDWKEVLRGLDIDRIITMMSQLHNRKHISESILQHRTFIKNFFVPLFSAVLPYAKQKWRSIKTKLEKELEEALYKEKEARELLESADEVGEVAGVGGAREAREAAENQLEAAEKAKAIIKEQLLVNDGLRDAFCPVEVSPLNRHVFEGMHRRLRARMARFRSTRRTSRTSWRSPLPSVTSRASRTSRGS